MSDKGKKLKLEIVSVVVFELQLCCAKMFLRP